MSYEIVSVVVAGWNPYDNNQRPADVVLQNEDYDLFINYPYQHLIAEKLDQTATPRQRRIIPLSQVVDIIEEWVDE